MPLSPHRLALAGILLAFIGSAGVLVWPASPAAAASPHYDPIVLRALQDEGTYQGECWPWVQRVVLDATGKQIGFDYRQGFLDAGAIEVSVADARSGDIIQVADDADTSPSADYPGLHTSIVMDNNGDGTFNVIDSNSQWDGVVHRRPDYDPAAMAARHPNLSFHIYRITPGPGAAVPAAAPAAAPTTAPTYAAGDHVTVKAGGDCLNLREAAATSSAIISCLPDGTGLTVLAPPVTAGGRTWLQVSSSAGRGWVAAEFVVADAASAASSGPGRPLMLFHSFMPLLAAN